tara:strand:- start:719 stop:1099 length:381 start_codon:yes stop_codon:yes gene_type:complete
LVLRSFAMGYTNYWYQFDSFNDKEWGKIKLVASELVKDIGITGRDGSLMSAPVINNEEIVFNGVGDSSCEPFILSRNLDKNDRLFDETKGKFNFCKTLKMYYDEHVWKMLCAAKNSAPGKINIESD